MVLTEEDKEKIISHDDVVFSSTKELVLVHKTKYMPTNSKIETANEAYEQGKTDIETFEIDDNEYQYHKPTARNTIHFSVNGPVSEHGSGNAWDSMPYAIFISFDDIPREQIVEAPPMDTFVEGSVQLTENTYVLCPEGQEEELLSKNPILKRENIIGYRSKDMEHPASIGFENYVIANIMKCKPERIGMWGWSDDKDDKLYRELMQKETLSIQAHTHTPYAVEEQLKTSALRWYAVIDVLREESLCSTVEDVDYIYDKLEPNKILIGRSYYGSNGHKIFDDELKKRLNQNDLPVLGSVTIEELEAIGITKDNDENKNIFRQCFPDVYENLIEQRINKEQQCQVQRMEIIVDYMTKYDYESADVVVNDFFRNRNKPINPINKELKDMTLSDYLSIDSWESSFHFIATNKEMQGICNNHFESKGIPFVINYDEKYQSMDPQEAAKTFITDCYNQIMVNKLNDEQDMNMSR